MNQARMMFRAGVVAALIALSCAGMQTKPAAPPGPAVHYDMEPVKIQATQGPAGTQVESFDAQELFEHAGAALSQNRYDEAVRLYDKLLANFPESPYARPAFYNRGLAYRDKKDWAAAVRSFSALGDKYPDHADVKDALFQMGACYAEMANWPASGEVFDRLLGRADLTADDRIEAMARKGFAQFNLGDLDAAEKTFRAVLAHKKQIEGVERLATDFYLAFSQYHLGQVTHQRFRAQELRPPEAQMERDLENKATLLLQAQRAYIEAIKYGSPAWASAAGFQVGSLYEELYDAFTGAPVPAELSGEARQVYAEELHKKIRVLLEKSVRWYRENLLMIERLGVNTDWAEKSKVAYAKLLKLLDPNPIKDSAPPGPGRPPAPGAPPPTPSPPQRDREPDRPPDTDDAVQRRVL